MIRSVSRSPLCSVSLKGRRTRGRGGLLLGEGGVHVLVQRRCDFFGLADVELVFCNVAENDHAGPMSEYPEPRAQVRGAYSRKSIIRCLIRRLINWNRSPGCENNPGKFAPVGMMNVSSLNQSPHSLAILRGKLHTMEKPNVSHQQRVLCCDMRARLGPGPRLEESCLAAGSLGAYELEDWGGSREGRSLREDCTQWAQNVVGHCGRWVVWRRRRL